MNRRSPLRAPDRVRRAFASYLRTGRRPESVAPDYACKSNPNHDAEGRFTFAGRGIVAGERKAPQPSKHENTETTKDQGVHGRTVRRSTSASAPEHPIETMRISAEGARLIRGEEDFRAKIYRPKGDGSGVTIGYGYDMGSRAEQEIYADLTRVGVAAPDAMMLSKAAGKKGVFADQFVAGYKGNTSLSEAQALSLFATKVRDYEQKVRSAIHVPLTQNQFDALTSLAYNAPAAFRGDASIVRHLNAGDFSAAADDFLKWNRAKVKNRLVESRSLTDRRKRERALFLRKGT